MNTTTLALVEALKLNLQAGHGMYTDFAKQGIAYDATIKAIADYEAEAVQEPIGDITYAHQSEPKGQRYRQRACDPIPSWATDIQKDAPQEAAEGWQPIETAPKDGSGVLLYCERLTVKITGGFWSDHRKCHCWIAGGYMQKIAPPKYWMPLPAPPLPDNAQLPGSEAVRAE